ncbi:hypothetical protein [Prosthecobacter sp.]|uniref:hypothetical protein n=1 Tax=Prosthecobacter sp. TaxID=1965333 RepID=UPI0037847E3C
MNLPQALRALSVIAAAFTLSNCATSAPHATFVTPLTAVVCQGDRVSTQVSTTDARMSEGERMMLADRITQNVQALAQPGGARHSYELVVNITRYTKGSGVVRTAMPGMGQMHVDGVVTIYQMPKHVPMGEFIVRKSFAIGGIYGLTVNMDKINAAFAEGVAKTVCQVR